MPKWDKFLDETESNFKPFEKIKKNKKIGRKIIKSDEEKLKQKNKEREMDEKRKFGNRKES